MAPQNLKSLCKILVGSPNFALPGEVSLARACFDGLLARVGEVEVEAGIAALCADGLALFHGLVPDNLVKILLNRCYD